MIERNPLPSREVLLYYFYYDREVGELYWRVPTTNTVKEWDRAGRDTGGGYRQVCLNKVFYLVHRIIYFLETGEEVLPPYEIDHKDWNKHNNKITNLEAKLINENSLNCGPYKNNKTGFKGVSWNIKRQMYEAQLMHNGVNNKLGYFNTPEEAAQAYDDFAMSLYNSGVLKFIPYLNFS